MAASERVPAENPEDLYEDAPCGLVSTLQDGTIIKVNATLLSWLGYGREELINGRRFADLLSPGGRIYHETHYAPLLAMQGTVREIAFDVVCADGSRLPVLVNSTQVPDSSGSAGVIRTAVFNAAHRREYERELLRARERAERSEARAKELAATLQASLIPPAPPTIPGLDIGAAYRPAGAGDEVGGDFYDVFETGKGDWAVVVGDVCGKGAAAAAVTALARHTIRAAAMRSRRPSAVLTDLNAALLRSRVERFCTAVYVRLRTGSQGRMRATIASAGHPLPIRIADREVAAVGGAGTLLGVLEETTLHDVSLVLEHGQGLFCYTDGLVEGRRGEDFFGDERLLTALRATRGRTAADATRAVIDEVLAYQFGKPRDDMAAVLIRVP